MLRKTVLTGFLVLMVGILFLYQSPERENVGERINVKYWTIVGQKEVENYAIEKFNSIQDKIFVEAISIPWQDHEKKILTSVLSGDPPDLVSQFIPVPRWASRNALILLDQFIERDHFDHTVFFPALWEEMKWKNHVYAIPVNTASYAFFYNREIFWGAGLDPDIPPKTWEDVWELSRQLVKRNEKGQIVRMGYLPVYGNLRTSNLIAWQQGAQFTSEDKTVVSLTNPETVSGIQWVVDFIQEFGLNEIMEFMGGFGFADQHGFISGKVAMMVLDSSFPEQIRRYAPNLDYGITYIPSFRGSPTASSAGSWWVGIPRGAANPEAAWDFIKFLVSKETQIETALQTEENLFPANKLAANDPVFITDPSMEIFIRQMDFAYSPSIVPLAHDVFWREYSQAEERAIHGIQTVTAALADSEERIQTELDRAVMYDQYVYAKLKKEEN